MHYDLMQHQKEALDFLSKKSQAALFFEMGLGKTFTILSHLKSLKDLQFTSTPILIVCPLSVVTVWAREVEKFNLPFKVNTLVGTKANRIATLNQDADIYVINYEGMRILEEYLQQKNFNCIILDESHRIKERKSQQTQAALNIAQNISYRYILSGTPITKSPEDIWTQIHFLQPGMLNNFYSFRNRYVEFKKMTVRSKSGLIEIQKPYRYKNLKELNERTNVICLRKTKAECLDLPEKIYKTIYCPLSSEQSKHYQNLRFSLQSHFESGTLTVSTASVLVQKLRQICQGFLYHGEEKETFYFKQNSKIEMLKDVIEDIAVKDPDTGEPQKIILFTNFIAEIPMLQNALSDYEIITYDGSPDQRQQAVDAFQNSNEPTIFLSNIEKAKEGITLTSANHVIYFSNSYNYGSRSQSEDRAHRVGQKKNVIYYDLVTPQTIDEKVSLILRDKKHTADVITGDSVRLAMLELNKGEQYE